ncbi:hypothetical protein DLAC_01319 [Tieghemostelium lacteum]|uniref:Uncharacterized protein n=1 Tax=Tieghemostelium lacteum TaxID=361077 RepID=A0A152A8E2_TIELA|nr:hypothetical protein DLAC_01319 [Tieghemostelium lacteum]|eukprot:KYR02478.1 hypothetical protein DLAC_01319 [Tieghemostelium lacteum]
MVAEIDFRYLLHNKVLWTHIKKFIAKGESIPERFINSLTWIVQHKHWNLLAYKLRRNERLLSLEYLTMTSVFNFFDYLDGDIELLQRLLEEYSINIYDIFLPDTFKKYPRERLQQMKFKIISLFKYLQKSLEVDISVPLNYFICEMAIIDEWSIIDNLLKDGYYSIGKSNLPYICIKEKNLKLFKYLHNQHPNSFFMYSTTKDDCLFSDLDKYHHYIFKQSVIMGNDEFILYYLNEHSNLVEPLIDVKLIMSSANDQVFDLLSQKLREKDPISSQHYSNDIDLISKDISIKECIKVFSSPVKGKRFHVFSKLIGQLQNPQEKQSVFTYTYIRNRHKFSVGANKQIYESFGKDFVIAKHQIYTLTKEEVEMFYGGKHWPRRVSLLNFIMYEVEIVVEKMIRDKLRKNNSKYLTENIKKSQGYIVAACRRKNNSITTLVLSMLRSDIDFTFLLKQGNLRHTSYLISNGFKSFNDLIDPNYKGYRVRDLLENSAKFGHVTLFQMIFNYFGGMEKDKQIDYSLLTQNPKILDYIGNNGLNFNVDSILRSKTVDPYLLEVIQKHSSSKLKEYLVNELGNMSSRKYYHHYQANDKKMYYTTRQPVFEICMEYGIPLPDNLLMDCIEDFDYEGYRYLVEDPRGPKLKRTRPLANLLQPLNGHNLCNAFNLTKLILKKEAHIPIQTMIFLESNVLKSNQYAIYISNNFKSSLKSYLEIYFPDISKLISSSNDFRVVNRIFKILYGNDWMSDETIVSQIQPLTQYYDWSTQIIPLLTNEFQYKIPITPPIKEHIVSINTNVVYFQRLK